MRYNRRVRAPAWTFAACALCHCGGAAPPADAGARADDAGDVAPAAPAVELGTGPRAWQDLPPDGSGRAEVVHGPQGGYHLLGRVRFRGLAPDVYVSFRVTTADGAAVLTDDRDRLRRAPGRGLLETAGGYECTSAELVILTAIRGPAEVAGRRVRVDVRVEEAGGGRALTDSREVTVVDEEP